MCGANGKSCDQVVNMKLLVSLKNWMKLISYINHLEEMCETICAEGRSHIMLCIRHAVPFTHEAAEALSVMNGKPLSQDDWYMYSYMSSTTSFLEYALREGHIDPNHVEPFNSQHEMLLDTCMNGYHGKFGLNKERLEMFLLYGGNIDVQDQIGFTLLHRMVLALDAYVPYLNNGILITKEMFYQDNIQYLLDLGADPLIACKLGFTPAYRIGVFYDESIRQYLGATSENPSSNGMPVTWLTL
jgi:hypothetical protein